MAIVTIHQAKTHLSSLIARAEAGEEIVIARGKAPVVRLAPVASAPTQRKVGLMKGQMARPPRRVLLRSSSGRGAPPVGRGGG